MRGSDKGFAFFFDESQHILRMRLWGLWDKKTAQKFLAEFGEKIQESRFNKKEWSLLADLTRFLPQPKDIQGYVNQTIAFARQHGLKKAAQLVAPSADQQHRMKQPNEHAVPEQACFTYEHDAIHWLLDETYSLP